MVCSSKLCGKDCTAKYKVDHCLNKNVVKFFKLNEHIYDHDIDVVAEKRIGLSKELKNVVEDIIVT